MGLFDFLKRQAPVLPAQDEPVPPALGWEAIEQAFEFHAALDHRGIAQGAFMAEPARFL
ncbi:MAG TPA: hypothetical protein VEX18_09995 [Polyangiaceae bacterium]|nr:hypothetical protein [Polyangiaceae bacterium]